MNYQSKSMYVLYAMNVTLVQYNPLYKMGPMHRRRPLVTPSILYQPWL